MSELTWDDFGGKEIEEIEKQYLPRSGEGDSLASQAVTATVKLIYKWFNDGDVYDNNYAMKGWANDLSSYANWLYDNVPETQDILDYIVHVETDQDYVKLLYNLMNTILNWDFVNENKDKPAVDSIYTYSKGPFWFRKNRDDWEDEYGDDY